MCSTKSSVNQSQNSLGIDFNLYMAKSKFAKKLNIRNKKLNIIIQ